MVLQTLPDCVLLHFAHADMEEQRGETAAALDVYERLALRMLPDPPLPEAAPADQVQTAMYHVSCCKRCLSFSYVNEKSVHCHGGHCTCCQTCLSLRKH